VTVTKHLADVEQRRAGGAHLGRGGVPQPVRADAVQASASAGPGDYLADPTRRQRRVGRMHQQEQAAASSAAPSAPAVLGDGLTHVVGQRQPLTSVALPHTHSSPVRQSMSSMLSAATSPARSPSRASTVRIAKSRRPTVLRRSQLANSRAT
jgi:hypothetical protein